MFLQEADESRAAGGGHLSAFLTSLGPLQSLVRSGHVAAETDLDHVLEAEFLGCGADRSHGDAGLVAVLAFRRGRAHQEYFLSCLDRLDDRDQIGLRGDRAEGACVDTVSAVDALRLVDLAVAVLIVADGVSRAGSLAGTGQVDDSLEGACLRAHAAFLTLRGLDEGTVLARGDGAELTGFDTGSAETETAVVGDSVGLDGAFVTGRLDDLDLVFGERILRDVFTAGKVNAAADDLALLIDAAASHHGLRARDHSIDQLVSLDEIQLICPLKSADFLHDLMPEMNYLLIICNHTVSSTCSTSLFDSTYRDIIACFNKLV